MVKLPEPLSVTLTPILSSSTATEAEEKFLSPFAFATAADQSCAIETMLANSAKRVIDILVISL